MTIHSKNNNGSMIPLASVATVIMVLLQSISWLGWSVTNTNLERIEKRVQLFEAQFLRVREHEEFTKRLDTQMTKIESRLLVTASRDELDARLGVNSSSTAQVRGEVDTLKRDLGQTYSIKDALKDLQDQIKTLQNRHYMNNSKPN